MSPHHPHRSDVALGLVLASAAPVELTAEGILVLLGVAALGGGLGGWMAVYDHVLCRSERVSPSLVLPWVIGGAVAMPGIAALQLVVGPTIWVVVIAALLAWAVRTSVHSAT
jgi:hypothetical protein